MAKTYDKVLNYNPYTDGNFEGYLEGIKRVMSARDKMGALDRMIRYYNGQHTMSLSEIKDPKLRSEVYAIYQEWRSNPTGEGLRSKYPPLDSSNPPKLILGRATPAQARALRAYASQRSRLSRRSKSS